MKNKFLASVLLICIVLVSMFPAFVNASDSTIVNGKTEYTIVAWEDGDYDVTFETTSAFTSCLIDNEAVSSTPLEDAEYKYKISSISLSDGMHKLSFETDSDDFVLDLLTTKMLAAKSVVDISEYYETTFIEDPYQGEQNGGTFTNYRTKTNEDRHSVEREVVQMKLDNKTEQK